MDPALEIRKLKSSHIQELTLILETHELWKRLMSIIPKDLIRFNYTCDVSSTNPHKYNSEHFKIIENASLKSNRTCTEILLDEWGTSGRVLPTVGHLLYLLTKAKLFRAADYVAVTLLNQPRPKRPDAGPEAVITVPNPVVECKFKDEEIEKILDALDYPSSAVEKILSSQNEIKTAKATIPKIVITPNCDETNTPPDFQVPIVKTREPRKESNVSESDMIKFSTDSVKSQSVTNSVDGTSNIEALNSNSNNNEEYEAVNSTQGNIPQISQLLQNENSMNLVDNSKENNSDFIEEISVEHCNPALSQLLGSEKSQISEEIIPQLSALGYVHREDDSFPSDANIPQISELHIQGSNNSESICDLPNFSELKKSDTSLNIELKSNHGDSSSNVSDDIPNISGLNLNICKSDSKDKLSNQTNSNTESFSHESIAINTRSKSVSINIPSNDSNSRPCNSPLPQLSLNTQLPHFNYNDLVAATNNFNQDLYIHENSNGRFLGSGAFGSVFLAFGLMDTPVAVKKLVLENVDYVDVDATVTKQFKNEVEVLSHYQHPNLLALVGYSCDGCTYCLLYEYIQGGALSVRLQAKTNKLDWKERFKIALGTAKAVAYLHTAFSTPLIHRDIKSANILLNCSNTPKLCDFGLIKLSPSQNTATATTVFGTSAYMAPEAFRGDISVKMDTFSFGVVLLELLTSLPPVDENRDGTDLVTHVGENCEPDSILPLLDQEAGTWIENGVCYSSELYKIATLCLEEKKKRPNMVTVRDLLYNLTKSLAL